MANGGAAAHAKVNGGDEALSPRQLAEVTFIRHALSHPGHPVVRAVRPVWLRDLDWREVLRAIHRLPPGPASLALITVELGDTPTQSGETWTSALAGFAAGSVVAAEAELPHLAETIREHASHEEIMTGLACGVPAPVLAERIAARFPSLTSAAPELESFTAAADCEGEDSETTYVVPLVLAPGLIGLVGGEPKAGKTTFVLSGISASVREARFLGRGTQRGAIVYATEEARPTFRRALRRAGLGRCEDLHVVYRNRYPAMPWAAFALGLLAKCDRLNAIGLVIDTLPGCAGLAGEQEQDAGVAHQVMRPFTESRSARPHLAVCMTTHTRKGGGSIPEAFRGSSAYTGIVDLLALLKVKSRESSTRTLETAGRLDDLPPTLTIEFEGGEYREAHVAAEAETDFIASFPPGGCTESEFMVIAKCSRTTAQRKLGDAHSAGRLSRTGTGRRNEPFRYQLSVSVSAHPHRDKGSGQKPEGFLPPLPGGEA